MIANTLVMNAWYVLGFSHEFPPATLGGHTVAGKPVVAWRAANGRVVAFDGRCLHKRMPLKVGRLVREDVLECAYHGFCYDAEGKCIRVPSQLETPIPRTWRLKPYPMIEQDGLVWIWPGDRAKSEAASPPRTIEIESEEWQCVRSATLVMQANYQLLIENLLDVTHFYPLHDGNVGDAEHSKIPVEVVEEKIAGNRGVKTIRRAENYRQPPYFVDWLGYEVVDRMHTHCMMSPAITRVEMRAAPPGRLGTDADRGYVVYHTHTPIDRSTHVWRWCVSSRAGHRAPSDPSKTLSELIAATLPAVVAQDQWAIPKQQEMFAYPDDGYAEVHVKADKALLMARKILAEMETSEQAS